MRTGCGKSQTSRAVGKILGDAGLRVALVRHPMPYGDLEAMRVQRFATLADIDAADPTVEEREEYEAPVALGMIMYAGVDYGDILARAEEEADVIVWDGGNNDFPFYEPDLHITVTDPLRAGHELAYHPGETNLRMADVVIVNKVDSAQLEDVERVLADVADGQPRGGRDHGRVARDARPRPVARGLTGARRRGRADPDARRDGRSERAPSPRAQPVPPSWSTRAPTPSGRSRRRCERTRTSAPCCPRWATGDAQLADLAATIDRVPCDVVVTGTPFDLGRLIDVRHPLRHARYALRELGEPTLEDVLAPIVQLAHRTPALAREKGASS